MTDRDLIKAELQNLQKILEAKADMCIGAGKMKMLSFANACSGALELLKEREWISVKDRLPEVRHAVLGYAPFHKNIWAVTMHEDGCWYFWYPGTSKYDPDWYGPITHWMPLPSTEGLDDAT